MLLLTAALLLVMFGLIQICHLDAIDIMAAANGRLDDLRLKTRVETDAGALTIQGSIGFDSLWRLADVDAHATTKDWNPSSWQTGTIGLNMWRST